MVHENTNLTHDLELVEVVFALMIWIPYLYGVYVDAFTDHRTLTYIFTQKDMNLLQRIWLELMTVYEMSILYHLGKANMVADALSLLLMGSVAHV
ncbi:hypothetical protein MTR67_012284 [Solanum verrucosum]|uniref:Reverse transcriptase RNase H-like domain-containing protein n=1 Tax=Solanum verrucosum TaxID=315347 RepID=A0AAF0Q8B3_SOLVR|nr:hypothetical protein MTR67_012284 [Solanum verrucosum]